ncbi:Non-specific serine/threonine protein kinase [Altererythrobacter insulae]|nr:Non-specific serine/threonine protein kinase [Altererythrobacter insulae]
MRARPLPPLRVVIKRLKCIRVAIQAGEATAALAYLLRGRVALHEYTYKAFISYSWADAKWGKWLQHAVETYRTPKALIEKHAGMREIPARLTPLFKDREEQAAGASIGASIEAALADSEYLIIICSPNSAQSQWVNHEIAWFKTNRNPDKILAVIVAGEPGDAQQECFPKALTHTIAPDLSVTDTPDEAPLAADARNSGDGKRLAKMKLVAAMLGVGLDQLLRRDDRRRVLRARVIAGASLALALVMSGLTWFAVEQRNEAQEQRESAEQLVESMLTDLRESLEPVGRLDALDVPGQLALSYYADQDPGDLNADSLGRRARALLLVGEVSNIRGNSDEALKAFTEAAATTEEQLSRDPDNEQRIFDHAQSVFWVGYIAYNRGELENAEAQFREYKRLADRLIELNPYKPEWQMESSYAEGNLGTMWAEQGRYAEAEPAFANALQMVEAISEGTALDASQQHEIGLAVNWLGIAKGELGKTQESLALHMREIKIYEDILRIDPTNTLAKNRLAVAFQHLAVRQLELGSTEESIRSLERSLRVNSDLRQIEPDNTEWQETEVSGRLDQAITLIYAGRLDESRGMLERASGLLSDMIATDPTNSVWTAELRRRQLSTLARLEMASGNIRQAKSSIDQALKLEQSHETSVSYATAYLIAGDVEASLERFNVARSHWLEGLSRLPQNESADDERFILLKRLNRSEKALEVSRSLDRRGFKHPAYLSER